MVSLANGEVIRMDDLRVGQLVQVTDPAGVQGTSKFVGWTEKHRSHTEFHKLTTESGNVLTMTGGYPLHIKILDIVVIKCFFFLGNHGLFIWKAGSVMATFAKDLSVGDFLVVSQSSNSSQVSS